MLISSQYSFSIWTTLGSSFLSGPAIYMKWAVPVFLFQSGKNKMLSRLWVWREKSRRECRCELQFLSLFCRLACICAQKDPLPSPRKNTHHFVFIKDPLWSNYIQGIEIVSHPLIFYSPRSNSWRNSPSFHPPLTRSCRGCMSQQRFREGRGVEIGRRDTKRRRRPFSQKKNGKMFLE